MNKEGSKAKAIITAKKQFFCLSFGLFPGQKPIFILFPQLGYQASQLLPFTTKFETP